MNFDQFASRGIHGYAAGNSDVDSEGKPKLDLRDGIVLGYFRVVSSLA
jgi:hypothetical protein